MASTRLKNFERAFRADRWSRQHFTGSGQLFILAIVASGVLGFDISRNLSYQIFSLLFAFMVLAVILSRFNRISFRCERRVPAIATVGQSFTYQLRVTNTSAADASDVLLLDAVSDAFPSVEEIKRYRDAQTKQENWFDRVVGYPRWTRMVRIKTGAVSPRQSIEHIPAGQSVNLYLSITPLRRGYVQIKAAQFGIPDPTGLFRAVVEVPQSNTVLVLPKRYPVANLDLCGHRSHHQGGVALSSSIGETGEFHGLREYQFGDPMRRIHWRSWARQGKPMVKTYEDEFFVRHALILDTYAAGVTAQAFEDAVSVAASIAVNVGDQESLLDLMFVEDRAYHFTSGRGVGDIQSMLEILACVQAKPSSSIELLQNLVLEHLCQLSGVVFVLLEWDQARQDLVNLVKHHGVDVRVLWVGEHRDESLDVDFMPPQEQDVVRLTVGHLEQGLARLG